jgi:Ino eighty subunit 1
MAASPSSAAATSDIEHSPPSKSHRSIIDDIDDSRITDAGADDPSEKASRSKKSRDKEKDKDNLPQVGKIRHLKKDDGEPLWRVDIQYDFLRAVFDNDQPVFTNSYDPDAIGLQTFADLYIDTMSRSTKTSKVLRDKLLSDKEAAKGMAMVCLLVNVGRMNTTLNCKAQTSHRPPSPATSRANHYV